MSSTRRLSLRSSWWLPDELVMISTPSSAMPMWGLGLAPTKVLCSDSRVGREELFAELDANSQPIKSLDSRVAERHDGLPLVNPQLEKPTWPVISWMKPGR